MENNLIKERYERHLNEQGVPHHEKASNGGRIPDDESYGTWLMENDPDAFDVGFSEFMLKNDMIQDGG
ncbi:hypothetical protein [Pseudalkalibacillus caeni]|uniref:Uncharacterized protein n=1 Tax=Exobacillus caeni TaxID=2574798 RepID=A0A5R9F5G2_9BACL|nr:hypothetical protein [Pseudalkalibacillus caeni]TLS35045.1 hypothetical protein FCL54_22570 [Pseudalkalibacillus caeni]